MLIGFLTLGSGFAPANADRVARYEGRRLADVLEELRAEGLLLVYSSAVVSADLRVVGEPAPGDPREILERILKPLGLLAQEGPGGTLVIVLRSEAGDRPDGPRAGGGALERSRFTTEVVVTPGRHSLLHEEEPGSRIIDPEDTLRVPNIGGDISRMVERLPGIAAGDNTATFHARGSLEIDTSLVLDGLELYAPYHLLDFQAPFSLIDSGIADRVELLNGGFTAERGDRHGAFLDISTVTPANARGEVELGTLNSRLTYGAPVARGRGSWLAALRAWYPEAFLDSLELGGGERLRPSFSDAYGKVAWPLTPSALLSIHGLLSQDRLSWQEQGEDDPENVEADTESVYFWLRLLASGPERSSTETVVSAGLLDSSRTGTAAPDDGRVSVQDDRDTRFFGLTHDQHWRVGSSHAIRAGVSLRHVATEYRYANEFEQDPGAARSFAGDPHGASLGAYVSYRAALSPSVATELGVRWDRQDHTGDSQLGPRFHLLWRPASSTDFRCALGWYSQSQRVHELQVEDGETEFWPAEMARQAEATFRYELPSGARLRVDAYYRELSDLRPRYENLFQPLDLFPETSEDRVAVAPTEARLRGIELLVSGDPRERFVWWMSYTRSDARDRIDDAWAPRSWDQPHAGKFLVGYQWHGWLVSLAGTAHTGWPTTPVTAVGTQQPDGSIEVEAIPGVRNSARLPAYSRFDLKLRRSFALRGGQLSLTLDVINLTDRENVCCVDDFLFGAPAVGPVEVEPELGSWLGLTPTFQVRWEF